MTFTYDPTTTLGMVRLLIPDTIEATKTFDDEELTAFLTMEANDPWGAAADALDVMANSEAITGKNISILGISTNGVSVCQALAAKATAYRARVGMAAMLTDEGFVAGEYMGIASGGNDLFSYSEIGRE